MTDETCDYYCGHVHYRIFVQIDGLKCEWE